MRIGEIQSPPPEIPLVQQRGEAFQGRRFPVSRGWGVSAGRRYVVFTHVNIDPGAVRNAWRFWRGWLNCRKCRISCGAIGEILSIPTIPTPPLRGTVLTEAREKSAVSWRP
jgi:hypothetical protein